MGFSRNDVEFISHGERCSAWLYKPDSVARPPLIIMAHGFGAVKNFGLEPFAERFAALGMAVLVFDYRGFGPSDGYPRNLISPRKHIQDWHAALAYARQIEWIDHSRIGLWGSSYSGGHVLCVAAQDPGVAAVVAQVPFVSGFSSSWNMKKILGWRFIGMCAAAATRDIFRALTFRAPYYIAAYGKPGEQAILSTPDSYEGVLSIIPPALRDWDRTTPARAVLYLLAYNPSRRVRKIKCPVLIIAGEKDTLIPFDFVKKTATKIPNARFIGFPCGHFDPYTGEMFEATAAEEIAFYQKHLLNKR